MKQLFSFVFAGILGGLIVLGGQQMLQSNTVLSSPESDTTISQSVNWENKDYTRAVNVPFDFKKAANIAMPAVVHIAASAGEEEASGDENDIFRFFFDSDQQTAVGLMIAGTFLDGNVGKFRLRSQAGNETIYIFASPRHKKIDPLQRQKDRPF